MKPILNIENLTKVYGTLPNQTRALNGITFQVMPGEFLGIMGSSGFRQIHASQLYCNCDQPTGEAFSGGRYSAIPQGKGSCRVPWQKSWLSIPDFELLDT